MAFAEAAAAPLLRMRLIFAMAGIGISVWALTVPFVKIRFGLDDGTLGLMLLAGGAGGVLMMPFAGLIIARFGSRATLTAAGAGVALLMPLLSLAPSAAIFTLLLFLYGVLFGALDIAMNAQGAVVERLSGGLRMSGFHACYSIGTLGVALVITTLLHFNVSYPLCAALAAAAMLAMLLAAPGLIGHAGDAPATARRFARPNAAAILLGLCCFACFMTEGAATDWSTIFLRFDRAMPLDTAPYGYAAFAVAMTLARFLGDAVATRLGQPAVMRLGCVLAVGGFGLVIFITTGWVDVFGFFLVGLGTGNIAPLVFSAAARVPGMAPNHSAPAIMALGYAGFLIGPVMIGVVAHHLGLGFALGVDAGLLGATFFAARVVG
ncbi:MFS transporter [Acidocella sp.]|uniref:MFS transporter n=1 Tax=Acidocella sp. TaxID=50710 RepID=UPI00260C1CC9|nr:MFS transporter [Acidocella sp.]